MKYITYCSGGCSLYELNRKCGHCEIRGLDAFEMLLYKYMKVIIFGWGWFCFLHAQINNAGTNAYKYKSLVDSDDADIM